MAARTRRPEHDEKTRAKIQTSQLINRLMDHALGKVEMSATQVKSAEILIRKTLPDLTATDVTTDGRPIDTKWAVEFINAKSEDTEETRTFPH